MKKLKRLLRSPAGSALLFILAAGLLLTGSIGGARAALSEISDDYRSRLPLQNIDIALFENGVDVSNGVLLEGLLAEGASLQPGRTYPEVLHVQNRGTIDEYVRVSVYRYWVDEAGNKRLDLAPELIEPGFANPSRWLMDPDAATRERTVLYYSTALAPGASSVPFLETLTVSGTILDLVETEPLGNGELRFVYAYNGMRCVLDVQADGVQTHNGEDAVRSAWGRQVAVSNGVLSLRSGQISSNGAGSGVLHVSGAQEP